MNRKRLLGAGVGASLLLAAGGSLLPASAGADESPPPEARSMVAGASAQGMRMGYSVPDQFAVSQFIDGGGPVAQVSVDSTGKAIGFGSLPYPGENAVAAPGVLTLATGAPIPPYPFYAEASYPVTPSAEVKDPGGAYTLSARAEPQKAAGLAAVNFGGPEKPVSRVVSSASGSIDPGGANVTAVSIGEGFRFGDGLLTIASGTSRSVTTYSAGADKPETTSQLVIVGAKVGDQAVTIGPDGVQPLGQSFKYPGGAEQLNQKLSAAGITVRTLSLQKSDGGATTEALQVIVKHPIPGSNVQGTFVYEFGGSTSFISFGSAVPGLPSLPAAGESTPPADFGTPAPTPAPAAAALPFPAGDAGAGLTSALPAPPASAYSGPASANTPLFGGGPAVPATTDQSTPQAKFSAPSETAAPAELATEPAALARADLKKPGRVLMAVLAAAGAILLAASTMWRKAL